MRDACAFFVSSGYSHAIFHVLLGGLFEALLASSQNLEQTLASTLEQGESQLTFRLIHANAWPAPNASVAPFRTHYCLHTANV